MRLLLIAALLTASNCLAQEQTVQGQQPATPSQVQAPAEADNQPLILPAGTHVQLILTNPMRAKATHPGDSVRAMTAFPVTVGKQLAIPSGSYVEGVVDKIIKHGPTGHTGLQMHFTHIVFSNGYNVDLGGATAEAKNRATDANFPPSSGLATTSAAGFAFGFQQQQPPPLPPPPRIGPSVGEVAGIGIGVAAAVTVTAIILGHRHAGDIVFDAGYQFEMVLQAPLTLDAGRVAAAVATPSAQ